MGFNVTNESPFILDTSPEPRKEIRLAPPRHIPSFFLKGVNWEIHFTLKDIIIINHKFVGVRLTTGINLGDIRPLICGSCTRPALLACRTVISSRLFRSHTQRVAAAGAPHLLAHLAHCVRVRFS